MGCGSSCRIRAADRASTELPRVRRIPYRLCSGAHATLSARVSSQALPGPVATSRDIRSFPPKSTPSAWRCCANCCQPCIAWGAGEFDESLLPCNAQREGAGVPVAWHPADLRRSRWGGRVAKCGRGRSSTGRARAAGTARCAVLRASGRHHASSRVSGRRAGYLARWAS